MNKSIPYGRQYIDDLDIKSVNKALQNDFITQGKIVEKFEKKFAKYVGAKYAIAVSSCSAGLHISCLVFKNKKNKHIITSPITFASTANAILHSGKKPIFADINLEDANISIKSVKKIINKYNVSGVIPVHFAGNPCDMEEFKFLCKLKNIFLIEDAAHALGSEYKCGSMVGSCKYSDLTVFSLHPLKSITTGEGGVITTNNKLLYKKLKILRSHGIEKISNNQKPWWYNMDELGFHYRLTDFQCALGITQLNKLNKFVNKREQIFKKYYSSLKDIDNCQIILNKNINLKKSNHLFVLKINFKKIKKSKKDFINFLKDKGINTQVHYIPIPMLKYYKNLGYNMRNLNKAKEYYGQAVSIPIFYNLSPKIQDYIIKQIKRFFRI